MEILLFITVIFVFILLWLNIIASIAVKYDQTLESFQKKAQTILIWLVPFLGASFVLHMVFQHSPEAIPKKLIPWPFKQAIYGKRTQSNCNPEENEIDGYRSKGLKNNPNYEANDIGDGGSD